MLTTDQIIQLSVAVGTILVAILAIWGDWFRYHLGLRPNLALVLHDPEGEYINILESVNGLVMQTTPTYYYHLRVTNKNRWAQATNVRIVITDQLMPASDGKLVRQPLGGPLQLSWRHGELHPIYSTVGPDDICDLGFVKKGQNFRLTPLITPNNFHAALEPNQKMRLMLKALADNNESPTFIVDISWDGKWDDDQTRMASHLVVKESRTVIVND